MLEGAGITKTALSIVISPVVGFVIAVFLMNLMLLVGRGITSSRWGTLARTNWLFRKLQLLSAAAYSLGHGANDAQKKMGIIAAVILIDRGASIQEFEVTLPIVLAAHSGHRAGDSFGRMAHCPYLGFKDYKASTYRRVLRRDCGGRHTFHHGPLGIPVSTTHTITGAIIEVGSTNRFSAVRWGLTGRVLYAWIVTIPGAAAIAAFSYAVLQFAPASMVGVIGLAAAFSWGVFFLIRKRRATQETVFAPPA